MFVSEPFYLTEKAKNEDLKSFLNNCIKVLKIEGVAWISTTAAALFDTYPDESLHTFWKPYNRFIFFRRGVNAKNAF